MFGDIIRFLNEQQMREQVSVLVVFSGYVECYNDGLNKYKDLEDSMWIEFCIVDIGIGILGIFIFDFCIFIYF